MNLSKKGLEKGSKRKPSQKSHRIQWLL